MTRRILQPLIDFAVIPLLNAGFEKRRRSQKFTERSVDEPVVAAIGPAYTKRLAHDILGAFIAEGGGPQLAPVYGVRHEGIMRLVAEYGIDLDGSHRTHLIHALFKPTLTCYAYLKDRQPGFSNTKMSWLILSPADMARYQPRVQACVKRIVLPYMRRCRSLEGIVAEMQKNSDARSYFPIAAGLHLLGRNEEVLNFLEQRMTKYALPEWDHIQDRTNYERRYARWLIKRIEADGWKVPRNRRKALDSLLRDRPL